MSKKVLVSTSSFGMVSNEPVELLLSAGYEMVKNPYGRTITKEEVIDLAADCIGVVAGLEPWDSDVISSCKNLKAISRLGVGMDNVDIEFAKECGITVSNTPYGPTRAVSEITLALTLALLRKIPQSHFNMKNGIWKKENGNLLLGKTIGIVGLGKIGKTTASLFRALGNKVIAHDLYFDNKWAKENLVEYADLTHLLNNSDIVILHLPGRKDKKPVISEKEIAQFKPGAFLINVSRGGVVDEDALIDALQSGRLKGAAIDVFSLEPYQGALTELENVVLTPHIGSYAAESKLNMEIDAVNNLIDALR